MKPTPLNELEKDKKFKKKYFPKQLWIKSAILYLPVLFLFIALLGLVFLLNSDMLISIYAIPFVILFLFATLWFKTLKKHVQNKFFDNPDSFLVCAATILEEDNNMVYLIFSPESKRHNKFFIEAEAKTLQKDNILNTSDYTRKKAQSSKSAQELKLNENNQDKILLKAFNRIDFFNNGTFLTHEKTVAILYINNPNTLLIKPKDI